MPGTLPQGLQRAGGMPELLAELQDAVGSQLIVAQVQAGEAGVLHQPSGQGWAAGARQPAAPQPAGPRQTGTWGLTGRLVSCSGWEGGSAGRPLGPLPQRLQLAGAALEPLAQQLHASIAQPLVEGQIQLLQAQAGAQHSSEVFAAGAGEAGVPQPAGDPRERPSESARGPPRCHPTTVTVPTLVPLLSSSLPWESGTEGRCHPRGTLLGYLPSALLHPMGLAAWEMPAGCWG